MIKEKIKPILRGLVLYNPITMKMRTIHTGGTVESRYCYSVWLRHLVQWNSIQKGIPGKIAELGPGQSLGTGLAGLLSGSESIVFLDVIEHWDVQRNLQIFDELVQLFKNKTDIPDQDDYPKVKPILSNFEFPSHILTDDILKISLSDERINKIRREIEDLDNPENEMISYSDPWNSNNTIDEKTIDFVYSQAVLEHVEDVKGTYDAIHKWLKKGGLMSHTIDFKSHGITKTWNAYRMLSEFEWKIVKGARKYLINRVPYSHHLDIQQYYNFNVVKANPVKMNNVIPKKYLSRKFKDLSEEDMTTSGAYILSIKV